MNQNIVMLVLVIASILFITNCKTSQKTQNKSESNSNQTESLNLSPEDLVGSRFNQLVDAPVNPEYGGINFVKFRSDTTLDMKMGDIVSIYDYKVNKNILTMVDHDTKRVFNMKFLSKDTFVDKYDILWERVK